MAEQFPDEDTAIPGFELSARQMANLIVDALLRAGVIDSADFARCIDITSEEIWVRTLLIGGGTMRDPPPADPD